MSELNRNTAASGAQRAVTAGERMKNKYVQSLRQARDGGNSQQKSATEFAEDEVAERARMSAAAAGQTANRAGNTAVRETHQSVEELKKQAQIRKAKKAAKAKRQAAQSAKETAAAVEESGSQTSAQAVSRSRQTANVRRRDTVKQAAKANPNRYAKSAGQTAKITERTVTSSARTMGTAAHATKDVYKRQQQAKQAAETSRKSIRATVEAVKAAVNGTKALVTLLIAGGWVSVVIILIVVLFGCSLSLFGGGDNSNSYTPVSAEVQAYQTLIQQYAKEHGIPEYVDLIMAVMMQESGGEGTDPMQASECAYNAKYPKTPNGITDPEYSINVGIRNLAACLKAAKVESPIDR